MLFDSGEDIFESEKERNLYYKFFAGYFFNDFVDGCESRLQAFCKLLEKPVWPEAGEFKPLMMRHDSTHVSFDNHSYLFEGCGQDRGEFADVLCMTANPECLSPLRRSSGQTGASIRMFKPMPRG